MNTQITGIIVNKMEYQKMVLPHLYINDEHMGILFERSIKCVNRLTELFNSTSTKQSSQDVPVKSTSESQKNMASQHKLVIQKDKNSCGSNGLNSTVVMPPMISKITVHKSSPKHTITLAESKSSSEKILQKHQSVNSENTTMIPLNRTAVPTLDRLWHAYRDQYKRAQHRNEINKSETIQNNQILRDDNLKSKQTVVTSSFMCRPTKSPMISKINVHKSSFQHTVTLAESNSSSKKILQKHQSVNSENTSMIPLNRTAVDISNRLQHAYRNQYKQARHSNENKCETIRNNQILRDDNLKSKQTVVTSSFMSRPTNRSPMISKITVHKSSPMHTITLAESKSSSEKILQKHQSVNSENTTMIPLNRTAVPTLDRLWHAYRDQYKRVRHSYENKCETIRNNHILWDDKFKSKQIVITSSPKSRPAKEAIKIRANDLPEIENRNKINSLFSTLGGASMKRNINDNHFEISRKKLKVVSHEGYQSIQTEQAYSSYHKHPSGQVIHNISDNTSLSKCHEKIINYDYDASRDSDVEIIEIKEEIIVISSDDDEN